MPAGPDDASLVFAIRAGRAVSAPACLSRRAVVCGFGALALTGCSSAPPPGGPVAAAGAQTQSPLMSLFAGPKVTSVSGQLVAAAGLNPSISGRPSPLTVRLYELSSLTAFDNADFISLYQGDKATLAAEMLARDDIVLAPGETRPYARNLNPALDCRSGHDMAFHCDAFQFLNDPVILRKAYPKLDADLARHGTSLLELSKLDCVRLMRRDREALDLNCQSDLDVSTAFGEASDGATARVISWCLLKTVSVARRIVTDRLHVAIAAALLERPCELLDNAYNKNRSVYEHSLSGFPNLSFNRVLALPLPDQPPPRQRSFLGILRRNARIFVRKHFSGEEVAQ